MLAVLKTYDVLSCRSASDVDSATKLGFLGTAVAGRGCALARVVVVVAEALVRQARRFKVLSQAAIDLRHRGARAVGIAVAMAATAR